MKIGMNTIGNYVPNIQRTTPKPPPQTQAVEKASDELITRSERQFFLDRYPDSKNEISDYHFYQRSGQMAGVNVGQLFDRRG